MTALGGIVVEGYLSLAAQRHTSSTRFKPVIIFKQVIELVELLHHIVGNGQGHPSGGTLIEVIDFLYRHGFVFDSLACRQTSNTTIYRGSHKCVRTVASVEMPDVIAALIQLADRIDAVVAIFHIGDIDGPCFRQTFLRVNRNGIIGNRSHHTMIFVVYAKAVPECVTLGGRIVHRYGNRTI